MPLGLLVVAEAEVEAELDVRRDEPAEPDQPLEDAAPRRPGTTPGASPSSIAELDVRVPLERELVVRDRARGSAPSSAAIAAS